MKPLDCMIVLNWLEKAKEYNGFYTADRQDLQ